MTFGTRQGGEPSVKNTTVTPLGAGETFTGEWERGPGPDVMFSGKTDVQSTLFFDFSNDGVNADSTFPVDGFQMLAGIHTFHVAVKGPRFFRIRIVNGASNQTYLRAYTYFGQFAKDPNAPLRQTIGRDADALIVRSVSAQIDLAFDRISGQREDTKFGEVELLDSADPVTDVWIYGTDGIGGSATKTFPTSAQDCFLSSSSASDTAVDVQVQYVDGDGAAQTATVTLTGQTPLDLGDNVFDVNRMIVTSATEPVGDIYANTENNHSAGVPADTSTVLAYIRTGYNQTEQATYTVPLGRTLRVKQLIITISRANGAAGSAVIDFKIREFGKAFVIKRHYNLSNGNFAAPVSGLIIPERSNIVVTASDVSDTDTNITAEFAFDEVTD